MMILKRSAPPLGLFLIVLVFSLGLRVQAIRKMSPTFDEPSQVFQGVYQAQNHDWYMDDIHPAFFPWFLGKLSPLLGNFVDAKKFSEDHNVFSGPYSYRLDLFSSLPQDEAIQRSRGILQIFWALLVFSLIALARFFGMPAWGVLCLFAFLLLEPTITGLTSLHSTDAFTCSLLATGTLLSLGKTRWNSALSLLFFSAAWATKLTPVLWAIPIGLGLFLRAIPRRTAILWGLGALGGLSFAFWIGGWDPTLRHLQAPNERLTFLDGIVYTRTPVFYFLQGIFCKLSLATLALLAWALRETARKPDRYPHRLVVVGTLAAGLAGASLFLPGLGIRLVLPLILCLLFFVSFTVSDARVAFLFLALLAGESLLNHDRLLAYQNPLAGSDARLLDSNRDWGQGLKELGKWRSDHSDSPLALALFGGSPPEMYGITEYRSLPSFPPLSHGQPLHEGSFEGYVAVSENFRWGYVVNDPSLRALSDWQPMHCFQGALCLYDVRKPRPATTMR